ncbi:MAG: DUF305 domain-containing protein [Actinobacteria bacterium]|nr:DUF305 domain-containing protein [Actinomycetota bacterium]
MKKYKGLLIASIILIVIGLTGIMALGLSTGGCNKGSVCRFNQSMLSDIDRHFIEEMIPHHQDAVDMAELAITKAEHDELKQLAESIKDSQLKEIGNMASWYKSWYGTQVPESTVGGMGMMNYMTDLKSLESAEQFDKEFIEQMIPHHRMAIMMVSMLINRTEHSEMKKLAQDIIKTQTEEINQMSVWYNEWY